ncbi:MAG TPA: hypothetical protein VFR41_16485 [Acidimicrobiia bacterium]|nr:hypothetical protein [Acidimicrobiia bacterium]
MDGIAAVEARIQEITGRFGGASSGGALGSRGASAADAVSFADALAGAQQTAAASAPLATGTTNRAGVDPVQWARDFLTQLGMPVTSENVRAIAAWQQAEGTAAQFNPLATTQAGFAGETRFNSVGVKNYASYADGITANVRAITNGLYSNILGALQQGTSAMDVAQAIANSPWGTHDGVIRVLQSQQ